MVKYKGESTMEQPWDIDGHFKLEIRGYDVFLTVHPPFGKGRKIEVDEVLSAISQWDDVSVDVNLVDYAVNKADETEIKIGEIQTQPKVNRVLVEVTDDEMRAYLTINQEVDPREIDRELRQKGVFHGINYEMINYLLERKEFGKPTLIAQGTPPILGEDAKLEYKFNINKEIHLKEKEDGNVDFKELGIINVATAGQVLVVKKPPIPGVSGMTVTGKEVYVRESMDIPLPVGKNTEISEDGLKLLAKTDGQIVFHDNKVSIEPVLEIKGNVDYSVGNIDFPGSVTITGSILDGFKVKAGGNIEVGNCIERAYVYAEGNIIVGAGIIGKGEGIVNAKKNVYANFVEQANIEAGEDVIVNESIRHSNVNAKKRVIVQGRIGVILGGRIRAGEEINAKVIGSVTGTPTTVEAGSLPLLREEIDKLKEELAADEEKFKGVEQGIKYLLDLKQKMGDNFPEDKEKLLMQHIQAKNTLKEKLYTMSMALPILEAEIQQAKEGKICAYKIVYPGVKISIRAVNMEVENEYKFVTFSVLAGAIKISPYEEPKGIRIVKEEIPKKRVSSEPKEEKSKEFEQVEIPRIAKLKIRLIPDSVSGVRLDKLKLGDRVYTKILDKNELKKVRDLITLKAGGIVDSTIEELYPLDASRSKIITRLGPGIIGETIVANKSKVKVPKKKLLIF